MGIGFPKRKNKKEKNNESVERQTLIEIKDVIDAPNKLIRSSIREGSVGDGVIILGRDGQLGDIFPNVYISSEEHIDTTSLELIQNVVLAYKDLTR